MMNPWTWRFDRGAFVLFDSKNRRYVGISLTYDGRWRWTTFEASGYSGTWGGGLREALGQFDLQPDGAEFFISLAYEALERARRELKRRGLVGAGLQTERRIRRTGQ